MTVILTLIILNIYVKIISNELIIVIKKKFLQLKKNYYSTNYINYCIITFIVVKIIICQVFFSFGNYKYNNLLNITLIFIITIKYLSYMINHRIIIIIIII